VHGHFTKLRDTPLEALSTHPTLINHAQKAMAAITRLVNGLTQPTQLVADVQTLARDHKALGITASDFKVYNLV